MTHALHPVHTRLVAERAKDLGAACGENGFLDPAQDARAQCQHLDLPAAALAEAGVHAQQVGREQRRLVAAGAGADLHDGIAVVEGVGGDEELGELALEPLDLRSQSFYVVARQLGQLRIVVGDELAGLTQLRREAGQPVVRLSNGFQPSVLAAQLLQLGRLTRGLGVSQQSGDLLRPRERLAESGLHGA